MFFQRGLNKYNSAQNIQLPQSQNCSELKTQYHFKNKISNLFYELNPKRSPFYQIKIAKEKMKHSLSSKSLNKPSILNDFHPKNNYKNQKILSQINFLSGHLAEEEITELSNYSFLEPKDSNMDDIHSSTFFPTAITPHYPSSNNNNMNYIGYINQKEISRATQSKSIFKGSVFNCNVVVPNVKVEINKEIIKKKDKCFLQYMLLRRKDKNVKKKGRQIEHIYRNKDCNQIWRSYQQNSNLPDIKRSLFMVKPELPFDSSSPEMNTETQIEIRDYMHKKNHVIPFHH